MKTKIQLVTIALFSAALGPCVTAQTPATEKPEEVAPLNGLTAAEKAEGWVMLWDGKTSEGWRSPKSEEFPTKGWKMSDGILSTVENKGAEAAGGGDIITRKRYDNFELKVDFRLTPGANSGVKIFVQPNISAISKAGEKAAVGSAIGLEFQILDDKLHPDAKLGHNGDRTIGSLYDLIPAPAGKKVMGVGDWNHARIVSKGKRVEFYLNGVKTVEFERGSADFRKRVAASKYQNIENFGEWEDGHIMLQEHGNAVSFCNVKLRVLQ
ncbi:MAG: DUF1080 domain-containing protein [Verrucomicrobiota bacterium]